MQREFKDCLILLRFHFSVFLLPTFFFAWSQVNTVNRQHLLLVFIIMHLLVYPASNGYNSYMDRDTGSIGGLEKPPPPNKLLFFITVIMDVAAILLSLLVNVFFTTGILVYIACSRAYSYRGIRLKKYPVAGFLTVFIIQGAVTFYTIFKGINQFPEMNPPLACMAISSLLIGALYPLTQIYQHEEDKQDGVTSISFKLGYRGTFIFSAVQFIVAGIVLYLYYSKQNQIAFFYVFSVALLPSVAYFFYWAVQVFKDPAAANFKRSYWMNIIASLCTNAAFILITIFKN